MEGDMHIAILSRNKNLHSIRRLLEEAKKSRIQCDILDPLECEIVVDGSNSNILIGGKILPHYDAILPRIGASITDYGLSVVKQFEVTGVAMVNGSRAIAESRDKMRCLQVLVAAGLKVPRSVLTRTSRGLRTAVETVKGMPVVLKLLQGTQGVGVMIVHSPISLGSVCETLHGLDKDVIIQQFIAEGAGRDYRAFVVGDRVVAAMMRTAPEGEFRSNIHRGGEGTLVDLPKEFERAAIKAAQTLGLQIAGVDLMESIEGPLVLEVNSSPCFEGVEKATGLNIARFMIQQIRGFAGSRTSKKKRKSPAKARRRKPAKQTRKKTGSRKVSKKRK
jgi:ribosomal protein S6--L-glutamate ligase